MFLREVRRFTAPIYDDFAVRDVCTAEPASALFPRIASTCNMFQHWFLSGSHGLYSRTTTEAPVTVSCVEKAVTDTALIAALGGLASAEVDMRSFFYALLTHPLVEPVEGIIAFVKDQNLKLRVLQAGLVGGDSWCIFSENVDAAPTQTGWYVLSRTTPDYMLYPHKVPH